MRVAVVGAGFGGLAAAAHLIGAGHDVTVFERDASPGGRSAVRRGSGFRLDVGPTILTMPDILDATFEAIGRRRADYVELTRVDPAYRAVFADGSEIRVRHGREAMATEIERCVDGKAAASFGDFCDWVTGLYEIQMPNFIDTNYDSPFDVVRQWRATAALIRAGGFKRLDTQVASFFDDQRLQRLFSFQSMYAGVAPHAALALYGVISYMDTVAGVYEADGGVSACADALARAIGDAGGVLRYEAPVDRVLMGADDAVNGVQLSDGERVPADAVVCNVDLPVAYRTLLGATEAPRGTRRASYSPSCLLWSAGLIGAPPAASERHNLHFGGAWRDSFDDLIKRGVPMADPSMLVSTASDSRSPSDGWAIHALEPMPHLGGKIDWVNDRDRLTERLKDRVAAAGYDVANVVVEHVIDPLGWESMGLSRGTPFSLAHTFRQTGPFRPRNTDERIPGLVFTGSATTPGVGVPMVLLSGKLAAERVVDYARETATVRW